MNKLKYKDAEKIILQNIELDKLKSVLTEIIKQGGIQSLTYNFNNAIKELKLNKVDLYFPADSSLRDDLKDLLSVAILDAISNVNNKINENQAWFQRL